jgi:hypothetical protein
MSLRQAWPAATPASLWRGRRDFGLEDATAEIALSTGPPTKLTRIYLGMPRPIGAKSCRRRHGFRGSSLRYVTASHRRMSLADMEINVADVFARRQKIRTHHGAVSKTQQPNSDLPTRRLTVRTRLGIGMPRQTPRHASRICVWQFTFRARRVSPALSFHRHRR